VFLNNVSQKTEIKIYNIGLAGCENKTQLDFSEGPNVNR